MRTVYKAVVPEYLRDRIWLLRNTGLALYLRRFGLRAGLTAWTLLRRSKGICSLRIPQSRTEILVRRGTPDLVAFEKIFLQEEYRPPAGLAPELIIDGGANVGYSAVYFANRFPQALILAVEPEPSNLRMLRRNARAYPGIRVVPSAIWGSHVSLRIRNPEADSLRFQIEDADEGESGTVGAVTVEDLLADSALSEIGLLKLDIEGAEREVFRGRPEWLSRVQCLMIELHERYFEGCERTFYEAILGHAFDEYRQGENIVLVRRDG